jgi:hypothetical protein
VCVYVGQRCTISERQAAVVSHICTVVPVPVPVPVPNICRSTVWKVRHVVFLSPRNLSWLIDFWKLCALLMYLYVCMYLTYESITFITLNVLPPTTNTPLPVFLTVLQKALQRLFQCRRHVPQRVFSSPLA